MRNHRLLEGLGPDGRSLATAERSAGRSPARSRATARAAQGPIG
jgi:hypothetical protein